MPSTLLCPLDAKVPESKRVWRVQRNIRWLSEEISGIDPVQIVGAKHCGDVEQCSFRTVEECRERRASHVGHARSEAVEFRKKDEVSVGVIGFPHRPHARVELQNIVRFLT